MQKTLIIGGDNTADSMTSESPGGKTLFHNPTDQRFWTDLDGIKKVGRYEIRRKLGQGGAGVVFLGWDPFIKRNVTIKLSRPTSDKAREMFFVEAQSAGRLNHPNIVAVYDSGVYKYFCYIAMEYVQGVTLREHCRKDNLLPVRTVVDIIGSACLALDYAHKEGVIHKDIKPANILLDKAGTAKISDFGIAQLNETNYMGQHDNVKRSKEQTVKKGSGIHIYGTPSYMSPEQLNSMVVGRESDIFSLGCVLYELLTGVQAFPGDSLMSIAYKINMEDPPSIQELNPNLPKSIDEVVKTALMKDYGKRFRNGADFAYNLRAALKDLKGGAKETNDFFDFIQSVRFFNSFSKDEVRRLVASSNIVQVGQGKVIINEGETDNTFYVLLSGQVVVTKEGRTVATIGAGESFGEMALLADQPRAATVIAKTKCTLMKVKANMLNRSPESVQLLFYQRFARLLAKRLTLV